MFTVILEARPRPGRWQDHLGNAARLRADFERADGHLGSGVYRSLSREGWLVSVSSWGDEKALERWRTDELHHAVQSTSRHDVLEDYRVRVGEVTADSRPPAGCAVERRRLDGTEVGKGRAMTIVDLARPPEWSRSRNAEEIALELGFDLNSYGDCVSWDVAEAVEAPGRVVLFTTWRDEAAADEYAANMSIPDDARLRDLAIIREYGMSDRREAPQFFPAARAHGPTDA